MSKRWPSAGKRFSNARCVVARRASSASAATACWRPACWPAYVSVSAYAWAWPTSIASRPGRSCPPLAGADRRNRGNPTGRGRAMSLGELLETCRSRRIELWSEAGRLRYRAPQGASTRPRRAPAGRARGPAGTPGRRPWLARRTRPGPPALPLTPVQAAYVLGRQAAFDYGGNACQLYAEYDWPVDTDPARLEAAWNAMVERHPMLRAGDRGQRLAARAARGALAAADRACLRGASTRPLSRRTWSGSANASTTPARRSTSGRSCAPS